MRDDHLRTNDFLDAENHPTITIKSTSIKAGFRRHWKMNADVTIRGVTKPVEFDIEYVGEVLPCRRQDRGRPSSATARSPA